MSGYYAKQIVVVKEKTAPQAGGSILNLVENDMLTIGVGFVMMLLGFALSPLIKSDDSLALPMVRLMVFGGSIAISTGVLVKIGQSIWS